MLDSPVGTGASARFKPRDDAAVDVLVTTWKAQKSPTVLPIAWGCANNEGISNTWKVSQGRRDYLADGTYQPRDSDPIVGVIYADGSLWEAIGHWMLTTCQLADETTRYGQRRH
jgi:hypothetical protein